MFYLRAYPPKLSLELRKMRLVSIFMSLILQFVSLCENPTGSFHRSVYAYARVIVLVTSKVMYFVLPYCCMATSSDLRSFVIRSLPSNNGG